MENSVTSMNKALSCNIRGMHTCDEESGWTMYFEDFLATDRQEQSCFSSGYESPSLISDAASSAAKKYIINQNNEGFSLDKSIKRMSCKRMKMVDDSLEDTASSPVSSPKVFTQSQNEGNKKFRQARDISQVQREVSGQIDARDDLDFVGRAGNCTDLKKRGLCLVPVSMMADYLSL